MDLKVIFDAIPEHIEQLIIKHVNQRSLCDNVCISVRRGNSQCTALRIKKIPHTRREHVYHVFEDH